MVIPIDEINTSISIPSLIKDSFIRGGTFSVLENGYYEMYTGGFSVVFPVIVGDEKWAFRCWHVTIDKAMERYKVLSVALLSYKLPYFINFHYEERGIVVSGTAYPTIRMKWVKGLNIKDYIGKNLNNSEKLYRLAGRFLTMVRTLHKASIAHGDLQHENIMVNNRGDLVLIDYDSLFIPELKGIADEDIIGGKQDYQHPCRGKNKTASSKLDYFSEVIILLGILGLAKNKTLWGKYHVADSDGLLFSKKDYLDIRKSGIYNDLDRLGYPFHELLQVLCSYLECSDINQLEPFDSFSVFPDPVFDIRQYFKEQDEKEKEDTLWKEVSRQDTIYFYSKYLTDYPNGKYAQRANKRVAEIETERRKLAEAAEADKKVWMAADSIGTIESYTKYLQNFSSGVNALNAKDKIEEIKWKDAKKTDTVDAYNDYLKYYPYGRFANTAQRRIKSIETEVKCWYKALTINTVDSYNAYLKEYPEGKHIDEANRLSELLAERMKIWRRTRHIVAAIFCIGLLVLSVIVGPNVIRYRSRDLPKETVNSELPEKNGRQQHISALENRTHKMIEELKKIKRKGLERNPQYARMVEDNLTKLKQTGSSRYNELKKEYESL